MSKPGSNNEIDSLEAFFSDKLKDAAMQPSDKVWQHIEGSLNQDKKRRRGFIWLIFCGLIFIGAGISTYVVMTDTKGVNTNKKTILNLKEPLAVAENKKNVVQPTDKPVAKTTEKENITTESTVTEVAKKEEEKINTVRIQLGAFKKQIDKSIFDKTGLDIKSETNEAGVTRYYAKVPEKEKQDALQRVQQAGFADAFIKKNTLLAAKNDAVKNVVSDNQSVENKSLTLVAKNNKVKGGTKNTTQTNLNTVAATKPVVSTKNTNTTITKTKNADADLPLANNGGSIKNETAKNENAKASEDKTKQVPGNEPVAANTNTVSVDTKQPEETKIEEAITKQDAVVASMDSVKNTTDETAVEPPITKTDSLKTEDKKKDEPVAAKTNKDSLPLPLTERWALLITGGPNFSFKNTQSSLFNTSGEKQHTTYNASIKAEYKLLKTIAVSLGLNYSYFTAQQDATLFYFNKNQTTDYIFYSSYGPMAVDMNTMMQDFNPAPWITTLKANYSYTSKINTLAVPLEVKWYFVNGKRINLYTALGGSTQFVLSEQTNLSIIKEHITNNLTYNQVNTSKFNAILMLGLGGDVRLYKKLYFTIDGGFRYGATNLSNTPGTKANLTYISANGGLKIKF